MKSLLAVVLIFTIFTIAVSAQELIPATSEDQELFDQELERAEAQPQKAVKSAADTKDRKARFGSLVKAEAVKLKASDNSARKEMGQLVSEQRRKNPGAADAATQGNSSSSKDGKNSAPGLNDSGSPGNSGNKKK